MQLDEFDIKLIKENYDDEIIMQIDNVNTLKIYNYLINSGVYYAKDFLINQLELFLLDYEVFVKKFEKIKERLGNNYIEKLDIDSSVFEIMYDITEGWG